MPDSAVCFFCGRKAALMCGSCGAVAACCGAHMRLHRREEEEGGGSCFPWGVEERPLVGRCMVTSRSGKQYMGDEVNSLTWRGQARLHFSEKAQKNGWEPSDYI